MASDKQVVLAAVAGAHGVGGEVRLRAFSEKIDNLKRHKRLFVDENRPLTLVSLRGGGNGAIARFAEITDRNAAEVLRGKLLSIPRSELPPLEEGEYYHADLVGLPCESEGGEPLGKVVAVENFGAGDLLEIEKLDGKKSLIPFRDGVAELRENRIVADPAFLA
ncbi:MAG TPA: ribosome maturation factor RimM [Allosphingosinicella sp.]|nr:ribosome maturation factor RimM [Allosphingosinicella sp.]